MQIKKITTFAFCLFPMLLMGQNYYGSRLNVFTTGYGSNNVKFNIPDGTTKDFSFKHVPLNYEFFSKNAYFQTDFLTPVIDLCLGAFNEEFWWGFRKGKYAFQGGDWPLVRFGLGGYVGNNLGLYFGGQWSYSKWTVLGENTGVYVYDNINKVEFGGHLVGPGFHQVLDFDKLMIRNSIMYDWVSTGFKGPFYTNALTMDLMVMKSVSYDNLLGVFVNLIYSSRKDVELSKIRFGISLSFDN